MNIRRRTGKRSAFSLLELIVTVVVVSLIAGLAVPAFLRVISTSRNETLRGSLRSVVSDAKATHLLTNGPEYSSNWLAALETAAAELRGGQAFSVLPTADATLTTTGEISYVEYVDLSDSLDWSIPVDGVTVASLSPTNDICFAYAYDNRIGSWCAALDGNTPSASYGRVLLQAPDAGPVAESPTTTTTTIAPTPPDAPTLDTPTQSGDTELTITWSSVSGTSGKPVTGYRLYRAIETAGTCGAYIQATQTASTSFIDTGRTYEVTYCYQVATYGAGGEGDRSNTVTKTVDAPAIDASYASSAFSADGTAQSLAPTVSGGTGSYSYSYTGTLPTGVSFDTTTGTFSTTGLSGTTSGASDPDWQKGLRLDANNTVRASAAQSDGKIVIAGDFTTIGGLTRTRVARLNSAGGVDSTFNTASAGPNSSVRAVAVQSDGKILIGGDFSSVGGTARDRVARLTSTGALDSSFTPPATGPNAAVNAIAVQSDGKVIIGGAFTTVNGSTRNYVARLNSDGSLDSSFTTSLNGAVNAVVVLSTDKILVGGAFTTVDGTTRLRVARLNSDGSLDTAFGTTSNGPAASVSAITVQSDGKVLIGGSFTTVGGTTRLRLARLSSVGALDSTFDTSTSGPASGTVTGIAVQSDGQVLAVLSSGFGGPSRYSSLGVLDANYGLDASDNGNMNLPNQDVLTVSMFSNGDSYIGGSFTDAYYSSFKRSARVDTSGVPQSVGPNGSTPLSRGVRAFAVQSDGKVVIGGNFTTIGTYSRSRVARLNADGSLDTGFATVTPNTTVLAVGVQSTGKIIIGGSFTSIDGTTRNYIARLNADGSLDTGFTTSLNGAVNAIVILSNDKILAGGAFTTVDGTSRLRVARLNANGSLDTDFGTTTSGPDSASATVNALAVDSNGNVLVAGSFTSVSATARLRIARLSSSGALDTSFGTTTSGPNNLLRAVALDSSGNIIVAGSFTSVTTTAGSAVARLRVARLDTNGNLDQTFATTTSGPGGTVNAVLIDQKGNVVIGGTFLAVGGTTQYYISRLTSSGTRDTSFAADTNGSMWALGVLPGGRVLAGGYQYYLAGTATGAVSVMDNDVAPTGFSANITVTITSGTKTKNVAVTLTAS